MGYVADLIYSLRVAYAAPKSDVIVTNTFFLPMVLRTAKVGAIYVHVARMPRGQMRLYRRASRFHAVSRDLAKELYRQVPENKDKVFVVPNALAPEFSQLAPSGIATRSRQVLYAGRIAREKGLELLITAFAQAKLEGWKLILVGPAEVAGGGDGSAYQIELEKLARRLKIDFEFQAAVYDLKTLIEVYSQSPIFVYPSISEGESFGMAPLEAMACGCAVIVSRLSCFSEFGRAGENCLVFDHRVALPVVSLAAALARLATNIQEAQSLATAGQAMARRFEVGDIADDLLTDFAQEVAKRGGRTS